MNAMSLYVDDILRRLCGDPSYSLDQSFDLDGLLMGNCQPYLERVTHKI